MFQLANGNEIMLLFGRTFAGIFHGLIYLTTIIHTAENASKYIRHLLMIEFGINSGISLACIALLRIPPYDQFHSDTIVAVPTLILIIIGIFATHIFTKESPIYLLQHQKLVYEEDLSEAYDTFVSLQKSNITTEEIDEKFDEIKAMLAEESQQTQNPFTDGNLKSLFLCLCCRLVALLSFNLPFIIEVLLAENSIVSDKIENSHQIMIIILIWFIIGTLTIIILHHLNKKYLIFLFSTLFGISSTFVRILFIFDIRYSLVYYLPAVLVLFYFYIVTLSMDTMSTLCISEAFSTPKRATSIAVIVIIEHLLHIILLIMYFNKMSNTYWMIVSLGLMGLSFKVYWNLPRDTDGLSLHQSVFVYRTTIIREWYSQANNNSRCVV